MTADDLPSATKRSRKTEERMCIQPALEAAPLASFAKKFLFFFGVLYPKLDHFAAIEKKIDLPHDQLRRSRENDRGKVTIISLSSLFAMFDVFITTRIPLKTPVH